MVYRLAHVLPLSFRTKLFAGSELTSGPILTMDLTISVSSWITCSPDWLMTKLLYSKTPGYQGLLQTYQSSYYEKNRQTNKQTNKQTNSFTWPYNCSELCACENDSSDYSVTFSDTWVAPPRLQLFSWPCSWWLMLRG